MNHLHDRRIRVNIRQWVTNFYNTWLPRFYCQRQYHLVCMLSSILFILLLMVGFLPSLSTHRNSLFYSLWKIRGTVVRNLDAHQIMSTRPSWYCLGISQVLHLIRISKIARRPIIILKETQAEVVFSYCRSKTSPTRIQCLHIS